METYDSGSGVKSRAITYEEFCRMMEEKNYDIQLGETLDVDVTDVSCIPYGKVIEKILSM